MTAGVLDQVVATHEALIAQWTQEALFARVGASVAGELVRASKFLLTVGPSAWERPLTCSMGTKKENPTLKNPLDTVSTLSFSGQHLAHPKN